MKKMCVFTNVCDDPYLETWLSYYSKHFTDIYVLNHNNTDDSIEKAKEKFNFTEIIDSRGDIRRGVLDTESGEYFTKEHQRKLLKEYEWVLYAHADEIIVPDPRNFTGIEDYVNKLSKDFVFCNGKTVLQLDEPDLDMSRPILEQRKWWWPDTAYNKPLLSRVPLNWTMGYHSIVEIYEEFTKYLYDPNLYLIHLQQANLPFFKKRSMWRSLDWFSHGSDRKEEIPDYMRRAF